MHRKLLLLLSLNLLCAFISSACSCLPKTVREGVRSANIVFTGEVIAKRYVTDSASSKTSKSWDTTSAFDYKGSATISIIFKMKIDKLYKGNYKSDTIEIITSPYESMCGIYLSKQHKIIVYANEIKSSSEETDSSVDKIRIFTSNSCFRTRAWDINEETEILDITK